MKNLTFAILALLLIASCTEEFDSKPVAPYNEETGILKELPDSGLIDLFEFTGLHGDTALNDINPGNYGIFHGGITHCPDRFGNPNRALHLDGTNGTCIITLTGGPLGNSPRTISLWFKPADTTSMQYFISYGSLTAPHSFNIGMFNDGGGYCIKGPNTDDGYGLTARDTVPPPGVWQNLVIVFDPTVGNGRMQDVKFYIHGTEWILLPGQICPFWDNNLVNTWSGLPYYLGSDLDCGRCFNGDLDDIRIYNRALSEEEIYGLFTTPNPVPNRQFYCIDNDTCQL